MIVALFSESISFMLLYKYYSYHHYYYYYCYYLMSVCFLLNGKISVFFDVQLH